MRGLFVRFLGLMILLASVPAQACELGGVEMVRAELLFGRAAAPAGPWADFLAKSVTPRFPDGLSVLEGRGQWRAPGAARISREASTLVLILAPMAADLRARLEAVRAEYKVRFHQQSVGLVTSISCVDF